METNSCLLNRALSLAITTVLTATFTYANAETAHKGKLQARNTADETKAVKAAPAPTGPLGVGALKIGMTFAAVGALTQADGIYPLEPLQIDTRNTANGNGGMSYKARMMTPLDPSGSAPVNFSFVAGKLTGFSVELDAPRFAQAMTQIAAKYGSGELSDERKDEQCLYRNGANFKINWGALVHRWSQRVTENENVKTSATEFTAAFCPPSLDGPSFPPQISHFIAFDAITTDPTPKPNPF